MFGKGEDMSRREHHVVYNDDLGKWDVKKDHAQRVSGRYDTKNDAMDAARQMSRNQNTELIPHLKNGRIQSPDSHGNDPCPPRDRN